MAIKLYTKEFARVLPNIYEVRAHFLRTFGGGLEVHDGVKESDTFLELKVSDTEVVLQDYSTDPNVAFGTGTGSTNRFGQRKEIKSVNKQVPYEAPLAIHEGIDDFTVNDIPDQVVAERLALHAEAWTEHINGMLSKTMSENASASTTGGVVQAFNKARETFVNNKIGRNLGRVAYVRPEVYSFLTDNKLTTTAKNSSTNIDRGTIEMFKGFVIEETPDEYFQGDENIYFAIDNIGVVGVGIQVARAFESEDFAGVALQAAAKYAKYLPEKNQKGLIVATASFDEAKSVLTPKNTALDTL